MLLEYCLNTAQCTTVASLSLPHSQCNLSPSWVKRHQQNILNNLKGLSVACNSYNHPGWLLTYIAWTRAGTIRWLSPTIVAEYFQFFNESIQNHGKSILFNAIRTGRISCSVHNLNGNSSAWQLAFEVSLFCEPINPLNCNLVMFWTFFDTWSTHNLLIATEQIGL